MKKRVLEFARTELVTSPITSTIQDLATIMKGGIIGSVFLTDEKGKIKGIVSDKDIFDLIAAGKNPLLSKPADIMKKLTTVDEDTPALDVLALMNEKNITRVGIKNKKGELIGIVSKKKLQFEQMRILKDDLGIEE
ncbi:MAG TPA: CBS domain-containing protein [Candidatus Lokiarchaeia archaeon]|nr:CBS domain-containing protein [Candidatus Lokiarchaeia archaeon]